MDDILIMLFGLVSAIGAFLAAASKIYDPTKRGINKVTHAGAFFILCSLILIMLPAFQNWRNKESQIARDQKQKEAYDSSLVVMKNEFDKSAKSSNVLITEILGKYGYKVDTLNMQLVAIRDSVKRTTIIGGPSPVFGLCGDPCKGISIIDSGFHDYTLQLTFISEDEGSSFFDIKISTVVEDVDGEIYFVPNKTTFSMVPYGTRIAKESKVIGTKRVGTRTEISKFYFWIRGTYKKIDGTGNYNINEVYAYRRDLGNTRLLISPDLKKKISDLVGQNE